MKKENHYRINTASAYAHGDAVPLAVAIDHLGPENVRNAQAYARQQGYSVEFRACLDGKLMTGVYAHYQPKKPRLNSRGNHGSV